jgi:ferric-dicitrate binding protein FerR (iron transport regulator)
MNAPAPPTAEQQQAALAWLGQINQQPARAEGAAFKRWLLADPAHPQAWRQAQALWQQTAAPAARLAAEEASAPLAGPCGRVGTGCQRGTGRGDGGGLAPGQLGR